MAAGTGFDMSNPIDLAGALARYSAALQSGLGASNQALDAQMAALNAGGDGHRGALLQLAAGFLSPTRTGSFGESLGNAVGAYATADAQARQAQMDRALKLAQIQQARASLMMEGAGSQFELAQTARKIQLEDEERQLRSLLYGGAQPALGGGQQALGEMDMPGALSSPIVDSTFQYGTRPYSDVPVAQVNAVPSPLPMFPPRTAAEIESADTTLNALRGTGGFGPVNSVDPVLGASVSRVLGGDADAMTLGMPYPSVPLDVPDDPLTASPMGPPARFGPRPDIPAVPQPLRRVPEADLPAVGANPAQARATQPGFIVPGNSATGMLSPEMTLPPERLAPMRERAAQMRGQRGTEAPASPAPQRAAAPQAGSLFANAQREYQRLLDLRRQNPAIARLPEYQALLKRQEDILLKSPAASGAPRFGLTPIYGEDENGNPVIIQLSEDGQSQMTAVPEGVQLTPGTRTLDLGTAFGILNRSGDVIGVVPKDVAGERREQAIGTAEGQAQAGATQAIVQMDTILDQIDGVLNHPGREAATGASRLLTAPFGFAFPGTATRDFDARLGQLQGQAFLQAFESLKGGGQITQIEGEKAERAIARLDAAQSEEAFVEALRDLRDVVTAARERAAARLRSQGRPAQPGTSDVDLDPEAAAAFDLYSGDR